MKDIIQVLPDVVANQIAAGEVIQRPASVVKELVENAVDAGADYVQIILKDAGRTLIQIIDNGCGMSENDARLSFERHATSKIKSADDLFAIRTMGFRGEALASIGSIAQVELKTKRMDDNHGTHISIAGSDIGFQQPVAMADGTSIAVKNLFYNVPARRRFLKTNSTELKHILSEFQRIALTHPDVRFSLHHNDLEMFHLTASGLRERIVKLMGKSLDANLVTIETNTSIVNISGFIGKPEKARKTYGEQFFFVNGRFMKHHYFHKAVMTCYESLLPPESIPSYFIYLETDPTHIDINIHPTKTEIKFDEERAIFQILQASVKEGLGKFNITPSLDFNQEGAIEIPLSVRQKDIQAPEISINPEYNPFESGGGKSTPVATSQKDYRFDKNQTDNWQSLYPDQHADHKTQNNTQSKTNIIQLKGKYLLTPIKSGLLLVHIRRAFERITYERLQQANQDSSPAQKLLYPVQFELNSADMALLQDWMDELIPLGFDIQKMSGNSVMINAMPAEFIDLDAKKLLEGLFEEYKQNTKSMKIALKDKLALTLSKITSKAMTKPSTAEEAKNLIDGLFSCHEPQVTASGRKIMTILQIEEIEQRF